MVVERRILPGATSNQPHELLWVTFSARTGSRMHMHWQPRVLQQQWVISAGRKVEEVKQDF